MRFSTLESPVPVIANVRFFTFKKSKSRKAALIVVVGGYLYARFKFDSNDVHTSRFHQNGHYTLDHTRMDVLEALRQFKMITRADIEIHKKAADDRQYKYRNNSMRSELKSYVISHGCTAARLRLSEAIKELKAQNAYYKTTERKLKCPN